MIQLGLPGISTLKITERPKDWAPDALVPVPEGVGELAIDFETTGLRWWENDHPCGVAAAWKQGEYIRRVYFPTRHAAGDNHDEARVQEWLVDAVRGRRVLSLNTKFDAHMSRAPGWTDWRDLADSLGDVGHYAALLDDHRRRFNLDGLGKDYLGEGKVDGLDMSHGAHVYPAYMVTPYAQQDAALVIRLMDVMRPRLVAEELMRVADLEDRVIPATIEMEANGCPMNVELLHRWERESAEDLDALQAKLDKAAGWPVNPGSEAHLSALFKQLGFETPLRTEPTSRFPEGQPSYPDSVMVMFAQKSTTIGLARDVGKAMDRRSKFLAAYVNAIGSDGIMRYGLNQLRCDEGGTVSGRYSSSALTRAARSGVNVQQVMSVSKQRQKHGDRWIIRELYEPAPGQLMLAADAKQIEFRLFVHLANSQRLIQQYVDNPETDFHAMVADMVHLIRPDFQRKQVKFMNFEQLYGGGLAKTAEMLGCSEGEARSFVKSYDAAFPEARALLRRASRVAEARGHVFTLLGRRTRFPDGQRLHKALNGVIQGSAADLNKLKLAELYEQRRALGFTMRMTVHDEVVGDVPDEEAARRVAALLDVQSVPLRVPILWDTKWGKNWAACA